MSFSENLHYLRKRDKITQEELADRLGVTRQSVSKWETGEASPETDKLILLCDLFHVSLDDIVRGNLSEEENRAEDGGNEEAEEIEKDKREFMKLINRFARNVALGVFLILFGVSVCVLLAGISQTLEGSASELTGIMGAVAVILFVAVAVFLFVFSGIEYDRFRKEHPVMPAVYGAAEIKAFGKKFATVMACLVSGILLDVVVLIVFSALIEAGTIATGNPEAVECYVTSAFLCVLSLIVGGLIYFGILHSKYNIAEYNSQSVDGKTREKRRKIGDALCGSIMLAATAIFLLLGFVWSLWHPGWVVFPIGGIICGIVGTITGSKD